MQTLLLSIILLSGVVFCLSVVLTTPKGGLGFGISGIAGTSNEYSSKKSIEHTLKNSAYISGALFVLACIAYPFV